jgi:hypothetical protein
MGARIAPERLVPRFYDSGPPAAKKSPNRRNISRARTAIARYSVRAVSGLRARSVLPSGMGGCVTGRARCNIGYLLHGLSLSRRVQGASCLFSTGLSRRSFKAVLQGAIEAGGQCEYVQRSSAIVFQHSALSGDRHAQKRFDRSRCGADGRVDDSDGRCREERPQACARCCNAAAGRHQARCEWHQELRCHLVLSGLIGRATLRASPRPGKIPAMTKPPPLSANRRSHAAFRR